MRSRIIVILAIPLIIWSCKSDSEPEPECGLLSGVDILTEPDDCGSGNGEIIVDVSGEQIEYSLDGGASYQTSGTFSGLSAGDYEVTVKYDGDCTYSDSVTVENSTGNLSATFETTDAGCGTSNGSVTIHATGGDSYTYSFDGQAESSDSVYTGLAQGTYFIRVYDENGCEFFENVTVNAGDVSYTNDVDPILMSTCATTDCHDGTNSHADLTNYNDVASWASQIKTRINNGSMPKTGTISEADKQTIICWVDDGAPNN